MSIALFSYIPVFALFAIAWYSPSFSQPISAAKYTNTTEGMNTDANGDVLVPCKSTLNYNFTEIDAAGFPKPDCEWKPQIAFYYVCYVLLGIFTPYQPHAIGYVSDISPKNEIFEPEFCGRLWLFLWSLWRLHRRPRCVPRCGWQGKPRDRLHREVCAHLLLCCNILHNPWALLHQREG